MIKISLNSPIILNFDTKNSLTCAISHQFYTQNKLGVEVPINYSIFMNLTEKTEDGKFKMLLDPQVILGNNNISILQEIKGIIGQCSQLSEQLFGLLKEVNLNFRVNEDYSDLFEPYIERYDNLDFMSHRNILSKILKSGKSEKINAILVDYDLKALTTSFYNLILDRNKYTHGELMHWYPHNKTILKYENVERVTEYGEVNKDILNSFISCYKDLYKFLNSISSN